MASYYAQCVRHTSVGDVATLRGRLRQPVSGTAKKDSDAAHLLRYGSIQSLPTSVMQYSAIVPFSDTGFALKPQDRTAAETIYATPMQSESPSDMDSPPPLPPPPLEFQSAASRSEVIPIATKVHHTYANVSEAIRTNSSSAVESSFRPGENACLSSAVNAGTQVTRTAVVKGDSTSNVDDTAVGSVEVQCSLASPLSSVSSNTSSSLNSSVSLPGQISTSVSSPSCSTSASPLPLPPPPSPPRREVGQPNWLRAGSATTEASKKLDTSVCGLLTTSSRESVALGGHKDVQRNATVDHLQRDYPPRQLLYGSSQTTDSMHSMVAPLKIIREHAQVARVTKRSFSVDAASQEKIITDSDHTASADSDSMASEDMHCGFLYLAECARQEYIKRRSSVIGCEEPPHHQSCTSVRRDTTTRPAAAADRCNVLVGGDGEFKRMIAQKAVELRRNRTAAVDEEFAETRCRRLTAGSHKSVANSASDKRCFFPQLADSNVDKNWRKSDVLRRTCDRGLNGSPVSLPGKTSVGFRSLELEPCGDELVILPPPPPDFADSTGANPSNAELAHSLVLSGLDRCALDMVPSPPPEFSDSPNRVGADFRRRPVATWSVSDVTQWLNSLQMSGHCQSFMAHAVDGSRLMALGRAELIALGVSQVGQRMNLERAIKRAVISVPSNSL